MQYEESYRGHRIIVSTTKQETGQWKASAELFGELASQISVEPLDDVFGSEPDAKGAALSRIAGAIDRANASIGKH